MSINVACPECQYRFLVGDEFAGRPGLCPECGTVIHVPGPEAESFPSSPEAHQDSPPPYTPRSVEAFEEFPRHSRCHRDDDRDRFEAGQRDDYTDDIELRTFDPHLRAARWQSVSNGLRNLMVAVILLAIEQSIRSAITLVDGVQQGQENQLVLANLRLLSATVWSLALRCVCGLPGASVAGAFPIFPLDGSPNRPP